MTETTVFQANSTFVIRFCRSCRDNGPCWRGRIEHVQSGKWLSFFLLEDMLGFIRSYDIVLERQDQSKTGGRSVTNS